MTNIILLSVIWLACALHMRELIERPEFSHKFDKLNPVVWWIFILIVFITAPVLVLYRILQRYA